MKDNICEECGQEFKSQTGKRMHYTMMHRDSATVSVTCSWCGSDFEKNHRQVDEAGDYSIDNHFCDKSCESQYKSQEWTGKDHPSWDGGNEEVTCEECGDTYFVIPSIADQSRFCSNECQNSNQRVPMVTKECSECGADVTRKPHNIKSETIFCSDECFSDWLSDERRRGKNPAWSGGKATYYGSNWNTERQEALSNAGYECELCGMARNEHYSEYDIDLDVHHRIPLRVFDVPENANFQDNLVVACRNCHQTTLESEPKPHNDLIAPKCYCR